MTAGDGLEGESPRECCGNLAHTFRFFEGEAASGAFSVGQRDFERWAVRLERACRRLDEARDEMNATIASIEAGVLEAGELMRTERAQFRDALIWCSGSPSFAPEGEAREGWLKLCAPLLGSAPSGAP